MHKIYIIIFYTCLLVCLTNNSRAQTYGKDFDAILDKVMLDQRGNIQYNWASDIAGEYERVNIVAGEYRDSIINIGDNGIENIHSVYNKAKSISRDTFFSKYRFYPFSDSLSSDVKYYSVKDQSCNDRIHLYMFNEKSIIHCVEVLGKDEKYNFYKIDRDNSSMSFENDKSSIYQHLLFDPLCRIKKEIIAYPDSLKKVYYRYKTNEDDPIRIGTELIFDKSNYYTEDCSVSYKWDNMGNWVERRFIGESYGRVTSTDDNGVTNYKMYDGKVNRIDCRDIRYKKEQRLY